MRVSQKCQYALRAVYELARHYRHGPVKIADIAENQAIPVRFLEQILSQLRQGGFVESQRGNVGGYLLSRAPADLTVGEIICFVEGPLGFVKCTNNLGGECPLNEACVFLPMWERARKAVESVYYTTTFENLIEEDARMHGNLALDYAI